MTYTRKARCRLLVFEPKRWIAAFLCLALLTFLPSPPQARAEFDWSTELALPDNDWSLGVSGGVAFGEAYRASTTGWLLGIDAGWLDGLFGVHGGLRIHREGYGHRVSAYLEGTIWYLVMIGVGTQVGVMADAGGPDVAVRSVALHGLFAAPIPVFTSPDGSLVLLPYARPGMRFVDGGIVGYHEAGLSLRWTSFAF